MPAIFAAGESIVKPSTLSADQLLDLIDRLGPQLQLNARDRDRVDAFAEDDYLALKSHGFHKLLIPRPIGGFGLTYRQTCAALRRLARHDSSLGLAWSMHQHGIAALRFKHERGDEAASRTLRRVADDDLILVTTGGRDWLLSNGSMRKVDGGYRVNAHKAFVSGCQVADVVTASAPYDDPKAGPQVLHFSVPMSTEGISIREDWQAHGMRGTGSHSLVFREVFVPAASIELRRPRGPFHPVWSAVVVVALPMIMSAYLGVADTAVDTARRLAAPKFEDLHVQMAIGEAESARHVAHACLERMLAITNEFDFKPEIQRSSEMLALKSAAADAVVRATEQAMTAAGGAGFYRQQGLERLLRDARAAHYHPMPSGRQVHLTGRVALGLPPVP